MKLASLIKNQKVFHSFTGDNTSVKYIREAPEIKEYDRSTPSPLPLLNINSNLSLLGTENINMHKTNKEIANSIVNIL